MACENYIKLKFQCSPLRFYCHIATLICLYIIFGCLWPTRLRCLLAHPFKEKLADSCFELQCIYYESFGFLLLLLRVLLLVFKSAFHHGDKISKSNNVGGRKCFGLCSQTMGLCDTVQNGMENVTEQACLTQGSQETKRETRVARIPVTPLSPTHTCTYLPFSTSAYLFRGLPPSAALQARDQVFVVQGSNTAVYALEKAK